MIKVNEKKFISDLNNIYIKTLNESFKNNFENLKLFKKIIKNSKNKHDIYCAANGGSNSIISHFSVDMIKLNKIKIKSFNEPAMLSAFTNDYTQEFSTSKMVDLFCKKNDILIIISSSGESKNLLNAANIALKKKLKLITFTGFKKDNSLSRISPLNIWVNSKSYNIVENIHQIMLTTIVDLFYGDIYYKSNLS